MSYLQALAQSVLVAAIAISATSPATAQVPPFQEKTRETGVEILGKIDLEPDNLTVLPDGRVVFSVRPYTQQGPRAAIMDTSGKVAPFPGGEWSGTRQGANGTGIIQVLAIHAGPDGHVWMLEKGDPTRGPRILGWNLNSSKMDYVVELTKPGQGSERRIVQDIVFDPQRRLAYAAGLEVGSTASNTKPVIIVVSFRENKVRFVPLAKVEVGPGADLLRGITAHNKQTTPTINPELNVPITIDPKNEWVYFSIATGSNIWRVPAADLADETLAPEQVSSRVQSYASKPPCTGMAVDDAGIVYLTEPLKDSIGVVEPGKGFRRMIKDTALHYPIGLANGKNGFIYVTVSKPRSAEISASGNYDFPFMIARFRQVTAAKKP